MSARFYHLKLSLTPCFDGCQNIQQLVIVSMKDQNQRNVLLDFNSYEMSVLNRRQPLASTPRNYGAGNDRQIFWTIATRISILMIFFTSFLVVLFFIAHGALMEVVESSRQKRYNRPMGVANRIPS
ncbi:uncharacterized protein LOC111258612 [Varroa jacobsoni]|uniref:uncharacterized protein LOC111258612 n=1 Tax=Varroa jacobsoni TaxID=62625 RepID=UPI000BFA1D7E|nr:uncharacterized protein LOC111258612 [Varroa jacobsoni]